MNPIGTVASLNGVEAVSCTLYVEFRITDIQTPVIDISTNLLPFNFPDHPAIIVNVKSNTRPILQVVSFKASDQPTRHVGGVASTMIIVIVVTILMISMISA